MSRQAVDVEALSFRRLCPWVHLFRAFGIAIDIRKIVLAGMALMMFSAGDWALSHLPFYPSPHAMPWETQFDRPGAKVESLQRPAGIRKLAVDPYGTLVSMSTNWSLVLSPVHMFVDSALVLLRPDQNKQWADVAVAWTRLIWGLCVWAVFGGAITRMAAVQFARDERVGISQALRFSCRKFLDYLTAPFLPISGVIVLWVCCLIGGLVGLIPAVGDVVVGLFWFLALGIGFLMSLLLIGVGAGWPLMFAGISAEGSDGFDGLSRAYSYVYDRPGYYAWLIVLATAYGAIVMFLVWSVTSLFVYLAGWSVSSGMGLDNVIALLKPTPELIGGPELFGNPDTLVVSSGMYATSAWLHLVALLLVGFVHSYFWCASTIIYFLLRKSDDGTELDEVYLAPQESNVGEESLPLVSTDECHPQGEPEVSDAWDADAETKVVKQGDQATADGDDSSESKEEPI